MKLPTDKIEKKLMKKAFPKARVGTGLFTYKEKCIGCGKIKLVDINAECKDCEKEMRAFREDDY